MFSQFRSYLSNIVTGSVPAVKDAVYSDRPPLKFPYTRPLFLQLKTDDEILVTADCILRPIILPRDTTILPWNSGYAEVINAGKSERNEDQATCMKGVLYISRPFPVEELYNPLNTDISVSDNSAYTESNISSNGEINSGIESDAVSAENSNPPDDSKFTTPPSTPEVQRKPVTEYSIPFVYFALFDGHAGSGVAVAASNTLHSIIQNKLQEIASLLTLNSKQLNHVARGGQVKMMPQPAGFQGFCSDRECTADSLIVGALESAFHDMDQLIALDKKQYTMTGGCTALVALFILGKLFVANAGDSRAVISQGSSIFPMSYDFTPESERNRIRKLAQIKPELLGEEFTYLEFAKRPAMRDLGEKILYRDAFMSGWSLKTVSRDDLKFPLIYGEGKRSRVLATIGVTRGFGDHDLKALNTDISIKPFLSSEPEVKIFNLLGQDLSDADVLIMGTDGLWDVTQNNKAAEVVKKSLDLYPANDTQRYKYRYTSAAQDLVMHARGKLREQNWRTADNKSATIDDISVFVIPLRAYKEEFLHWRKCQSDLISSHSSPKQNIQTV